VYENGSNLDLRPQGYELRGQMKEAEGRTLKKESGGELWAQFN